MDIVKCLKKNKLNVGHFIEEYLQKRENISLIILVLDIRHKPTADDKAMYDYMIKTGKPFFVITNKADKIAITKVDSTKEEIREFLNPMHDIDFLPFSSERKIYIDAVWENIEKNIL